VTAPWPLCSLPQLQRSQSRMEKEEEKRKEPGLRTQGGDWIRSEADALIAKWTWLFNTPNKIFLFKDFRGARKVPINDTSKERKKRSDKVMVWKNEVDCYLHPTHPIGSINCYMLSDMLVLFLLINSVFFLSFFVVLGGLNSGPGKWSTLPL
jgi:hypothetical protein